MYYRCHSLTTINEGHFHTWRRYNVHPEKSDVIYDKSWSSNSTRYKKTAALFAWCRERHIELIDVLGVEAEVDYNHERRVFLTMFRFLSEQDAMLFKLSWNDDF